MEQLRREYRRVVVSLVIGGLLAQSVALRYLLPFLEDLMRDTPTVRLQIAAAVLSATAIYTFVVFGPLKLYEKFGWKVLHPHYDYAGVWMYELEFEAPDNQVLMKRARDAAVDFIASTGSPTADAPDGVLVIEQTPLGARLTGVDDYFDVVRSASQSGVLEWRSRALGIEEDGSFTVAFHMTVGRQHLTGIDELEVDDLARSARGRPMVMRGRFSIVPRNASFLTTGRITYRRATKTQLARLRI